MDNRSLFAPVLAITLGLSVPCFAQNDTQMVPPTSAMMPMNPANPGTPVSPAAADVSPATTAQGIPMISGGVGEHEMDVLKSVESQYNVKLVLTEKNGVYLSAVPVKIVDAKGVTVLDTVTKGPILLATLPPGTYEIGATSEGESKNQKITVADKSLKTYQLGFRALDARVDAPAATIAKPMPTPAR